MTDKDALTKLNESFGSYRAEWLRGKIFEMFAEPSYFTALQDNRPCVLEGGRGTGKTTVLRGLSYQGQFALHSKSIIKFDENNFIGIYHRVDTNHVRAFSEGGVTDDIWMKLFGHYFNLIICREILVFLKWHKSLNTDDEELSAHSCELIGKSLHLRSGCNNLNRLLELLDFHMYEFQSTINSISDEDIPPISLAGDPIKITTSHATSLSQFSNKIFFLMLDEYENYTDVQQQLLNTLIKHSTEHYSFKIGVRELGWRIKHTLNPSELLHDPADFVLVNIEQKLSNESLFSDFAKTVCQQRIRQIFAGDSEKARYNIEEALENLTIEQEAELLGVEKTSYFKEFESLPTEIINQVNHLSKLYLFFINFWSKWHNMTLEMAIKDYLKNTSSWDTRYDNYKYNTLFKIRKGRGKRGIQKYYAGWSTYIKLANGNIRYLMELVYRAYYLHISHGGKLNGIVSSKDQTIAAQEVGLKNLTQLEGAWKNGAQLTKILLGMGRVFQVIASTEGKIAPEKNQFSIENSESISEECRELITAAVMNLALVRSPGNKLTETTHTRDYIYMVHPIFSAFFVFSFRRKRKLMLKQQDILGLISNPKETIRAILKKSNVSEKVERPAIPSQMQLFEHFYYD